MAAQPFLAAGFVFVVVMTVALVRVGRGEGGRHWALAWTCLWVAGGLAMADGAFPGAIALAVAFGTAFAALFLAGTLRFLGRPVPRAFWMAAAALAAVRVALSPWTSPAASDVSGALVISAAALGSSALLLRHRRPDGAPRDRLLAAAFPLAAVASTVYAGVMVAGAASWIGVFVWLMAGILLSGAQVVSMVRRIAERAESERAVLASLIESVPVGLALFDPQCELRAANHAFRKILGAAGAPIGDEREALGRLADQLGPDEAEALQNGAAAASEAADELHLRSGANVVLTIHAVTGAEGEPMGRLWLLRDVTEERRLQESLERARRLETLGGFAGGVAHDFNNQLTSVLGNAMLVRDSLGADHPAQEILADLATSAEHCARLTRDVLDFARRGAGRPEAVDLRALLPDVVARCDGGRATLRIEPGVPVLRADPIQIERVLANLVENARHAAGADGHVAVEARREPSGAVAIEVGDDGPGIPAGERARIFDPFYTTRPVGEGSGLGLAIVYGIVTGQGGEVRVECPPGGGTRMTTTWPDAGAR